MYECSQISVMRVRVIHLSLARYQASVWWLGERLVAATAAKQKLRGVELHAAHGRVTGRDATRAPLSLPQPIVPSCRLQIGGGTLTCECLLDQERSRRSRRGAGAAGEDKPQRSCEPKAHAAGEGSTSAEGAVASTSAACCQEECRALWA